MREWSINSPYYTEKAFWVIKFYDCEIDSKHFVTLETFKGEYYDAQVYAEKESETIAKDVDAKNIVFTMIEGDPVDFIDHDEK